MADHYAPVGLTTEVGKALHEFSIVIQENLSELRACNKNAMKTVANSLIQFKTQRTILNTLIEYIYKTICKANQDLRLPLIYLVDMAAHIGGDQVKSVLVQYLISMFSKAFQYADSAARSKMYKIRKSWTSANLFPASLLHQLDLAVRGMDPNWPLKVAKKTPPTQTPPRPAPGAPAAVSPSKPKPPSVLGMGIDDDVILRFAMGQKPAVKPGASTAVTSFPVGELSSLTAPFTSGQDVDMRQLKRKSSTPASVTEVAGIKMPRMELLPRELQEQTAKIMENFISRQHTLSEHQRQEVLMYMSQLAKLEDAASVNSATTSQTQKDDMPEVISAVLDSVMMEMKHKPNQSPLGPSGPHVPPHVGWHVEVPGLREMPYIGLDPRLLSPVGAGGLTAPRWTLIQGDHMLLHMERLQPLALQQGVYRAVRYLGDSVPLVVDGVRHVIPLKSWYGLHLQHTTLALAIGGPGHEVILDGKAYNIPFEAPPQDITVGRGDYRCQINVKLDCHEPAVQLCPPIPDQVMHWAERGLFGSASQLYRPPRHPLSEERGAPPAQYQWTYGNEEVNTEPVDVFGLVNQLVEAGLLPPAKGQIPKLVLRNGAKLEDVFHNKHKIFVDMLHAGELCEIGHRHGDHLQPEEDDTDEEKKTKDMGKEAVQEELETCSRERRRMAALKTEKLQVSRAWMFMKDRWLKVLEQKKEEVDEIELQEDSS